jgi:hypothetical protein
MTNVTQAQLIAVRNKLVEAETRLYEATKIMNYMFEWSGVGGLPAKPETTTADKPENPFTITSTEGYIQAEELCDT